MGPRAVHKVRHDIFGQFLTPFPLSHTVTHPGTLRPKKLRHTYRTPLFLVGLVQKIPDKSPLYKFSLNCSRGFFRGILSGGLLSGGLCPGWFCPFPLLSEYICYNRKLNTALDFMFHM